MNLYILANQKQRYESVYFSQSESRKRVLVINSECDLLINSLRKDYLSLNMKEVLIQFYL